MMISLSRLALAVFLAAPVAAEDLNLLVCTARKYALSRPEALQQVRKATRQMDREIGTKWRLRNIRVKSCGIRQRWQSVYSGGQFGRLLRQFDERWELRKNFNLAVIPALEDGERRGIGGVASDVCGLLSDWNLSIAALTSTNHLSEDRMTEASTIIAHELGHQVGCDHDDVLPITVMNSNPAPYVKPLEGLNFGNLCKQEKKRCSAEIDFQRKRGWIEW